MTAPASTALVLADLLVDVAPGSRDDWSWEDESRDLWTRDEDAMWDLAIDLQVNGQQQPVTIGDDGRLWDGHHRVVALWRIGAETVLVRWWEQMTEDERLQSLIDSSEAAEQRGAL